MKDAEDAKAHIAEREQKEKENGRRFGGKRPQVPDAEQAKPAPRTQRNFTDPESRIQKTADGFIQGYTAVLAVDDVAQVIVVQHVTPNAPEQNELIPIVSEMMRLMGRLPEQMVADAGYWSEANASISLRRASTVISRVVG